MSVFWPFPSGLLQTRSHPLLNFSFSIRPSSLLLLALWILLSLARCQIVLLFIHLKLIETVAIVDVTNIISLSDIFHHAKVSYVYVYCCIIYEHSHSFGKCILNKFSIWKYTHLRRCIFHFSTFFPLHYFWRCLIMIVLNGTKTRHSLLLHPKLYIHHIAGDLN